MTDTAPASHPSSSANAGCCHECCPCDGRLKKLEKTVSRIRFWLFVSLGFLILLIGIGIGQGDKQQDRGGPRGREEVRRIEVQGMPMGGMRGMGGMGGMGGGAMMMRGGPMQGGPDQGPMMNRGPDRGPEMRPEGRPGKGNGPKMRGGKKGKDGDDDDDDDD